MNVEIGTVAAFPNVKHDKEQAVKVLEEAGELYSAWEYMRKCESCNTNCLIADCCYARRSLLNECADVIQAVSNMVAALGVESFRPYIEDCEQRNIGRGRYEAVEGKEEGLQCGS